MYFALLGPLEVREGERAIEVDGQRQRAALAALLMRANEVTRLPDGGERAVDALRRVLGESRIETRPGGHLLRVQPEELDLLLFERLAAEGEQALRAGDFVAAEDLLARALRLWRGEPLEGQPVSPELQAELARLSERGQAVARQHALAAEAHGPRVPVSAHRQLPRDIADFTGREAELRALYTLAGQAGTRIAAIEGMPGVGKTRLAVHAAHQLVRRGLFDEIQLWTDLRGFDPAAPPVDASTALAGFLHLLGVPGSDVPSGLDERAALYRERLAGKRALVLLDNAVSEEQVRPLLPGTPDCFVLITSRRALSGLDGVTPLRLTVFSTGEARDLLARIADEDRISGEPEHVARLAALCDHLPIALAIAARRLRSRPQWTVADLVDRLDAARGERLDQLSVRQDFRAVFDLSYRALPQRPQRLFRLLAVHPGVEFGADSVTALDPADVTETRQLLEILADEHLVMEASAGRYRLHDLVRLYATEQTTPDERLSALERLCGWYLHAADAARSRLAPTSPRQITLGPLAEGVVVPGFADYAGALAWYEDERANLRAVIEAAAGEPGLRPVAWRLAATLLTFYYVRSYWTDWIGTHETALRAAKELRDEQGEAAILRGLGVAFSDLRRFDDAIECHRRAQELLAGGDNTGGKAWNLNNLGVVYVDVDRLGDAEACFTEALGLFRATGDVLGEGICLNNLGDTARRAERPGQAIGHLERALAIQEHADDAGRRFTLLSLGDIHRDAGDHDQAVQRFGEALDVAKMLDDQRTVARCLTGIGHTFADRGDTEHATAHWRRALTIYDALGDPDAAKVRLLVDPSPPKLRIVRDD
ncbi:tetratricopeptide repeat protein [Amycolatopsis acidicola]|uniref:Tetratricopeptide repeat protein n=1 Tax=Amycolatopsis acidicola TaxID=2596893 RepID=A0A5N0UVG9_9PSEU|nr:tetratricopeptide repeat protein [Amycolatopsis acidicola]KAA9156919.1 tetratricopeptide repeat protein [Amycolatopsis acidicola]